MRMYGYAYVCYVDVCSMHMHKSFLQGQYVLQLNGSNLNDAV